jgi:hypothetical protein
MLGFRPCKERESAVSKRPQDKKKKDLFRFKGKGHMRAATLCNEQIKSGDDGKWSFIVHGEDRGA